MGRIHRYEGTEVIVEFEPGRCIHTGDCTHGLPEVFDTRRSGRWVHPDGAAASMVALTCAACPTGALRCIHKQTGEIMLPEQTGHTVQVIANGPLYVHADMVVNGQHEQARRAAFCRCGQSRLMPWCDNSHRQSHFTDAGVVSQPSTETAQAEASGPLQIHSIPNGPLLIDGPFTLIGAGQSSGCKLNNAAFCRCGASGAKPYCDGSHLSTEFESSSPATGTKDD
ncbi:hypothetical protein FE236_04995 [Mariprofundus erugo]|uniref:CDGSH iron-sulfur domain-containing protein n=1 Tax=Mariprofundus erugo TaxID=2528639 RepID=UPI0010FF2903|nr:CDGSH iron-sulfur domain-containing protein [Mariprofundus erugo]TLS77147.1 hypothetical protein FE236_04995 [Mariprofundus erugo]